MFFPVVCIQYLHFVSEVVCPLLLGSTSLQYQEINYGNLDIIKDSLDENHLVRQSYVMPERLASCRGRQSHTLSFNY